MAKINKILVLGGENADRDRLVNLLKEIPELPFELSHEPDFRAIHPPAREADIVFIFLENNETAALNVLRSLRKRKNIRPIIACFGAYSRSSALELIRSGADDCLSADELDARNTARAIERARSQHELRKQVKSLRTNNSQLQVALRQTETVTQAKSDFLAHMSHEIRTPLAAILGFAEHLLEDEIPRAERNDITQSIIHNGEYLLKLLNDILDLSKIEARKLEVECIDCSLIELVSGVISLMRIRAEEKGIGLNVRYRGSVPHHMVSDPTRLRQILINLISNAIKFTEVGDVRIVVSYDDTNSDLPRVIFEVIDSGIGMTPDELARVFDPFAQAATSTSREFGGTGLGLAISKRFAVLLGGDLTVTSQSGKGSQFKLEIEAGPPEKIRLTDRPEELAEREHRRTAKLSQSGRHLDCRILVAEDNPINQKLVSLVLKKTGAEVVYTDNGQAAVDQFITAEQSGKPFDIILMDMQMPVMDGFRATKFLRSQGYKSPIIALTAHAMDSDREKCLEAGCNDMVTKPYKRSELLEAIYKQLLKAWATHVGR